MKALLRPYGWRRGAFKIRLQGPVVLTNVRARLKQEGEAPNLSTVIPGRRRRTRTGRGAPEACNPRLAATVQLQAGHPASRVDSGFRYAAPE